jgi:hypothetical protein
LDAICRVAHEIAVFLFGANKAVDRTALWTGAIAVVTALAAGFSLFQLRSIRIISRAEFTKRFIDSFFVEDSRTLFTLLLNSALEFAVRKIEVGGDQIDELPYLRIKKEIADQLAGIVPLNPAKTGYSAFEVDDFLLGHFEDVGWYARRKLMDLNAAYQSFGFYVVATLGLGAAPAFGSAGAYEMALNIGQPAEYRQHQAPGAGAGIGPRLGQ